jgi:hypothetical protein
MGLGHFLGFDVKLSPCLDYRLFIEIDSLSKVMSKITIDRLNFESLILGRCLMALSPKLVDKQLFLDELILNLPKDIFQKSSEFWFELQYKNHTAYIWVDKKGKGRSYFDLPDGIDSKSLISVNFDEENRLSIKLLNEFLELLKRLAAGITTTIVDESSNIEFIGKPENYNSLNLVQLIETLEITKISCNDNYNERIISEISKRLRENLLSTIKDQSTSTLVEIVANVAEEVRIMRYTNAADAHLASWFMVYKDLCSRLAEYLHNSDQDKLHIKVLLTRYIAFGCAPGQYNPDILTPALAEKISHEGFHQIVKQQAENYLKSGEKDMEEALDSQTFNEFSAFLYNASLNFFAARRLFDALWVRPSERITKEQLEVCKKSSGVSEEGYVRASTALVIAWQNRNGEKLEEHKLLVQIAFNDSGESGAEDLIFELIEMSYFYPRYFESILRGRIQGLG